MTDITVLDLSAQIRSAARPLRGQLSDYDKLLGIIGDAHFVLLGEASHGTREFYRARAEITQRLIVEKGFDAVAVEGDWPDAYRVDRYVRGRGSDGSPAEALAGFRRFPAWMWRNREVSRFVDWLRSHNAQASENARVGFYGLDLYSLHTSMEAVIAYLDAADPAAAREARERYACFDHFGEDLQRYGLMSGIGGMESCEQQVVRQLVELRRVAMAQVARDSAEAEDAGFHAARNAELVKNAEAYYRAMFTRGVSTWNLRDQHMEDTLEALVAHLGRRGAKPRIVVWAHNSHVGDARATEMGRRGELNLGQLVRQRHGADAVLVGFTTHRGFVTAASEWGAAAERKAVRPGLRDSIEALFHATDLPAFLLPLRRAQDIPEGLHAPLLERAIGVIYLPHSERASHYFHAELPRQFDAVLHFDETDAVEPLERTSEWESGELPETYPSGL